MADDVATNGTDTIVQTDGPDRLFIFSPADINPNDFFDGLGGFDTIELGTFGEHFQLHLVTTDATHGFHNYEALSFANPFNDFGSATISAAQFGSGLISNSLAVVGNSTWPMRIEIIDASNFSAAAWTFTNWTTADTIRIIGTAGADTLTGSTQVDDLRGGDGNDVLMGGPGDDTLRGEGGTDTASYRTSSAVTVDLAIVGQQDTVGAGLDTLMSIENLIGSAKGSDTLTGDGNANTLTGLGGNDTLRGNGGNDVLIGGKGRDIMFGGPGADRFDFNSIKETKKGGQRDKIMDFKRGQDDIDLKGIDAKKGVSGNQKFKFIGNDNFHKKKGELRYEDKGSKVIVQGDINGDGKADFEIFVKVGALSAGDFLL